MTFARPSRRIRGRGPRRRLRPLPAKQVIAVRMEKVGDLKAPSEHEEAQESLAAVGSNPATPSPDTDTEHIGSLLPVRIRTRNPRLCRQEAHDVVPRRSFPSLAPVENNARVARRRSRKRLEGEVAFQVYSWRASLVRYRDPVQKNVVCAGKAGAHPHRPNPSVDDLKAEFRHLPLT